MNWHFLNIFSNADPGCVNNNFLGLPPWYKYLEAHVSNQCAPQVSGINDFWLIGLAVIEILTRVAVYAAIIFVVYGGIKYSASRGNTDKVNSAKNTLTDALTGLIIAIVAAAVVSFIAGRFGQS